jgi:4'-phosphopantetheinyl transferase
MPAKSLPNWDVAPADLWIEGHDVHVWRILPVVSPDKLSGFLRLLQPDELRRFDSFYRDENRFEYLWAHGALRTILSRYLRILPAQIQFATNYYGRPYVANPTVESPVFFSLSHTEGLAMLAVSRMEAVGLDVERCREMADLDAIVANHFSGNELLKISSLNSLERQQCFFRCWTRKEAVVKATGFGLSLNLNQMEVTLLTDEPAKVVRCHWEARSSSQWALKELEPAWGYVGAVALEAPGMDLRLFTLDDTAPAA